jgi:hypothetical protein
MTMSMMPPTDPGSAAFAGYSPGAVPGAPTGDGSYADAPTTPRARKALILGILAIFPLSVVAGIPAIITGVRALRDIEASDGFLRGTKTAWTGIALGVIGTLVFVGYLVMAKR